MRKKITALLIIAVSISLFASFSHAQDVYTDNVVIVLDDSGSMDENMRNAKGNSVDKMDAAKVALYEVLKQIPKTTHVGLVTFGRNWIYPLGPKDDAKLKSAIDSVRSGGGTPLGDYIKIGADRLLQEKEKQYGYGSYRLLVVTDGEAGDQRKVDRYTPEVTGRAGITLDVIGVAMAGDHTLKKYANSYRAANDPDSLVQAIKEVFAEVGGSSSGAADTTDEVFAELASIPNEVAVAMISAFSTTGNHPIGTKPKPKVVKAEAPAPTTTPAYQSTPSPTQPQDGGFPILWVLIALVGAIAGVVVLVKAMSS